MLHDAKQLRPSRRGPMSPENLASFYSDLKNMIFDNPKFKV